MTIEQERLVSLVEFAQQSARLRKTPVHSVTQHGSFTLHEHQLQGLPGIRLNNDTETEDEIWLSVERLPERKPPEIASSLLKPWVQLTQGPNEEPLLLDTVDGASLIAAGTHCSSLRAARTDEERAKPVIDPQTTVMLADCDTAAAVKAQFAAYLPKWRAWADEEKLRRKTIQQYAKLFTLKQQLEGGIVEAQLELVWGVGLGIWNRDGQTVEYPLVGRLVEISVNAETAEIQVRPRDADARIEVDWYVFVNNPGVADLEKAAKEHFGKATTTFSPFDPGTFEPLLRAAVTHLDSNGAYWPDQVPAEDRSLPRPENNLKVTDTWILFARPRTSSLFVQDLERLKEAAEALDSAKDLPPAVAAVVSDPASVNPVVELPEYRGLSATYHGEESSGGKKARDLYFPKPFNDEQVRIVQMLDGSDGVVVQGPPGTGKTHTIANVICHYLAEGMRVLVTSMKDPALAVLHEHLPDEIRPLAISLLTSEQDGMKQFEHAIHKIASEVQSLDRKGTARELQHLKESIDALHGKLSLIDRAIGEWGKKNLAKISIDGEEIAPQDAARQVVAEANQFEWIPDELGVEAEFVPQFSDADIVRLREARRVLGRDIDYLGVSLPQLIAFPDSKALLELHQDISHFERLQQDVANGGVPSLANSSQHVVKLAENLLAHIERLQHLRDEVVKANRPWTVPMRERLRKSSGDDLLQVLETLGAELEVVMKAHKGFLKRPVTVASEAELDPVFMEAAGNLAAGKRPFGLKGLFGKSAQKQAIDAVKIVSSAPADANDWVYVNEFLRHQLHLRELAMRWNALAPEIHVEPVSGNKPTDGLAAARHYWLYVKIKGVVKAEAELCEMTSQVFPNWPHVREAVDNTHRLAELEKALVHHKTKNQLANVWATKERFQRVLEGRTGRVVGDIRTLLTNTLGNPIVADAEVQAAWSAVMAELARVLELSSHLASVREVCDKVAVSGAPQYAALLKQPLLGTVDTLLPGHWRRAWRLRRIDTHLEAIDAREELRKLAKQRHDVGIDLSRTYRDVVVKSTWLKLAEKASPSIRAALQAYLTAVQKTGRGTGKRAVRYRQDARKAASLANPAVPCWIMPHYRVSESLPAELGCFDLVVIDEASQSDLTALPALLRARKVLIVGDDKQVSPEGVGLEEEKIKSLMTRFLGGQVETYRPQMSPERSIYDLFKVVFAGSSVMLKEHFRCVGPIIEYSKREFYNHELRPLRIPKASERIDPPLVDVLVRDGYRNGDINQAEVRFIVDEIKRIVADPKMSRRSIGVVSLLADKQALEVWQRLTDEVGPEIMERHRIACGDARTFQGKERDIMFLSMVSAPNEIGAPLSRDTFAHRFNVAASRARDRMYLVRSVDLQDLSEADRLRRSLISHFSVPFAQDEARVENLRTLCEGPFEPEMYDELTQRGYWVTPQVRVGKRRIDLVVEGHNDARLAVECDGDSYHGPDHWSADMDRQRELERAGWVFWRCFASAFLRRRKDVMDDLLRTLSERGIDPIGAEGAPRSVHTEHRMVEALAEPMTNEEPIDAEQPPHDEVIPSLSPQTTSDLLTNLEIPVSVPQAPSVSAQAELFIRPSEEVVVTQVIQLCRNKNLKLVDNREKKGALWVKYLIPQGPIATQLGQWGFRYAEGKGWWRK
jgi:very-short-patch-repair endonuclease